MDDAKGLPILLEHTKPTTVVRGRRGLVGSGGPLVLDDFRNLAEDSTGNRTLSMHPRDMGDDGDLDGGKVLRVEATSLVVGPRESSVVHGDCHDFRRFSNISLPKSQAPTLIHSTHDMFSLPLSTQSLSYLLPHLSSYLLIQSFRI